MKLILLFLFFQSVVFAQTEQESVPTTPTGVYHSTVEESSGEEFSLSCCQCWPGDSFVISDNQTQMSLKQRFKKEFPRRFYYATAAVTFFAVLPVFAYVQSFDVCRDRVYGYDCIQIESQNCRDLVKEECGQETKAERFALVATYGGGALAAALILPVLWIMTKHGMTQCLSASSCVTNHHYFLTQLSQQLQEQHGVVIDVADLEQAEHMK